MKALVYQGTGERSWTEVPDPAVRHPRDAIIRIDAVTICDTDLHILAGHLHDVRPGRILGHEAVGTVVATGDAVTGLSAGDRVLASCISACGLCRFCREGVYGQCRNGGGWALGHRIDGVQAEYARIPYADLSTYRLPEGLAGDSALLLADTLPTAYEVGVRRGRVRPGDTVVIVGAGPIGLAAVVTARLYSPAHVVVVDVVEARLQAAKNLGADVTLAPDRVPIGTIRALTGGLGADVVIEAVGTPEAFELCTTLVRPGGRIATVGVHGAPAMLHLEHLWAHNITVTTGLVDTSSTTRLLGMVAGGQIDLSPIITHRMALDDIMTGYDLFAEPSRTGALKVVLSR
ncbi:MULTISPECIES: alcohol dehydrogenase catalytic domain-containing protein [Actinoplanes]|uniref:alcohol dehydrogenase catalytic domain-containing protein n=1 Tax=Actinoplanes TaxID=1865 RepID=UPI0005F295F6|nr:MULTISPECIES: alcohol dehydrogenase catalytic domain-containing protein [Actinoplanes]GLY07626.1 alcohol dehydrogenase [Actinoplanes sp. NBRC 101535]